LVSSEAAVERYRRNLLGFEPKKFLEIGRPQLDFYEPEARRVPSDVTTVLYAPTWRATHESMDYSSVTRFGLAIAQAFVNREDCYFIYRPHPGTGTTSAAEAAANRQIVDLVGSATNAELHRAKDIGGVFSAVDAAVFDNSSVAVDFLRADKPMFITRVGASAEADVPTSEQCSCAQDTEGVDAAPILTAAVALESSQAERVADMVLQEIREDTLRERRRAVGRYYLGNSRPGESTQKFVVTVGQLAALRDTLCAERETLRSEPITVGAGTV
jgi:CDP-glycerol glycerophosphotransferase (TagB/SpsB family)